MLITILLDYQNLLLSDYQRILVENVFQLIAVMSCSVPFEILIEYALVIMTNDTIMFWIYFLMNYGNET